MPDECIIPKLALVEEYFISTIFWADLVWRMTSIRGSTWFMLLFQINTRTR
jgi:hypothetical protein